jgi:hypothetical protein
MDMNRLIYGHDGEWVLFRDYLPQFLEHIARGWEKEGRMDTAMTPLCPSSQKSGNTA